MQLFETALESFWFLGLEWDESSQQFLYSIKKNVISQCVSVVCIISTFFFLIKEAKTFDEFTESLFVGSTAVMCSIITTFLFIKLDLLSKFIKTCKIAIIESK